ncbi:MAG: hypothetical protein Q8909_07195 [Bacteroidota bacterium]|nr:hypothetical protein [Bacteroidota bacterium]
MNLENFKADIEVRLNSIAEFELLEFHYQPYSFGSGLVVYRINGRIHKFVYDGRDNILTWLISKEHQKYITADLSEYCSFKGLFIDNDELSKGIKSTLQCG